MYNFKCRTFKYLLRYVYQSAINIQSNMTKVIHWTVLVWQVPESICDISVHKDFFTNHVVGILIFCFWSKVVKVDCTVFWLMNKTVSNGVEGESPVGRLKPFIYLLSCLSNTNPSQKASRPSQTFLTNAKISSMSSCVSGSRCLSGRRSKSVVHWGLVIQGLLWGNEDARYFPRIL